MKRHWLSFSLLLVATLFILLSCTQQRVEAPGDMDSLQAPVLLNPLTQPKFVNPLPNPLDPSFIFQPTSGNYYDIGAYQIQQNLGLINPATGAPLLTTVWGYGTSQATATYPGRTFVVEKDEPITVRWTNNLVDESGKPLPHLLPIDTTLHWADPLSDEHMHHAMVMPYTGPVPIVTHLHGGHTASDSDGLPDAWFTPNFEHTGHLFNEVYTYDNDQEAATLWYHDHALGITRLNVYAGLAGFYILRDKNEEELNLPSGPYEVPIVIQDRMFTADGQLYYPSDPALAGVVEPNPTVLPEFFGDFILVNGQAWPYLNVEPRQYRLRLLNGSDSRFYTLFLSSGQSFMQIGSDTGLLNAPVTLSQLTLGPGERADVVLNFASLAGQTVIMRNNAKTPFPQGTTPNPRTTGQIMAFRVGTSVTTPNGPLPSNLRPLHGSIAPLVQTGPTRQLLLFEGMDDYGRMQPLLGTVQDGALMWHEAITETVKYGDVEVWEIYNTTPDAHPIHLHLVSFQVLSRQKFTATQNLTMGPGMGALSNIRLRGQPRPPAANEAGWKDTVIMYPGEVTRIIAHFDRVGEYVWHCHILSHEDHEMMRPYVVR